MADISITSSSVLASSSAEIYRNGVAGVAITAGQVIYKAADGTMKLSDSNGTPPANSVTGIALCGASAGQPITYVTKDPTLTVNAALTAGIVYVLSATPGGICPAADLASGVTGIVLGVAKTTSTLNFDPVVGGAVA